MVSEVRWTGLQDPSPTFRLDLNLIFSLLPFSYTLKGSIPFPASVASCVVSSAVERLSCGFSLLIAGFIVLGVKGHRFLW